MNFKKKVNGSWADTPHYVHKTATDTITTLPAVIYPNATTATVGLKGNMSQTGTSTPDNPIMPEGTGDLETVGAKAGQYKIPILSANTTTPVYLGEVESTRRIKKLVLTGNDGGAWNRNVTIRNGNGFYNPNIFTGYKANSGAGYCTHYPLSTAITDTIGVFFGGNINFITDFAEGIDTVDKWITYLQQQYDAGTPVTIWYVLATPETGIVNEPLMKIGDYADEVSGISIPTIAGANSFDVLTTLKPSEVSLAYTGWHDAMVKEWDGSQWQ